MWFFPAIHIQPSEQTGIPNSATSSLPNMTYGDPARVEVATAEICLSVINESVPMIRMCAGPLEQAELISLFSCYK